MAKRTALARRKDTVRLSVRDSVESRLVEYVTPSSVSKVTCDGATMTRAVRNPDGSTIWRITMPITGDAQLIIEEF